MSLPPCFAPATEAAAATPLITVDKARLAGWKAAQPEPVLAWLDAHGFQAAPGAPLALPGADGRAGMPGNGPSVVCRSREGERVVCNTGMNGRMQLISRFKNSGACIEGRTWGQRRNHVWVSDNCRARFAAVYPDRAARGDWMRDDRSDWMRDDRGRMGDGSDYSVVCTSNGSPQHCNWDTRYGTPRLVQRTSQADCVQGRSWGYTERGGLWVSEGCHARFAVR